MEKVIYVLGDSFLDHDIHVDANPRRLNDLIPRFKIVSEKKCYGGGANVVVNLQTLLKHRNYITRYATILPTDPRSWGTGFESLCNRIGVELLAARSSNSTTKTRYRLPSGNVFMQLDDDQIDEMLDSTNCFYWDYFGKVYKQVLSASKSVIVFADYGKEFFRTKDVLEKFKAIRTDNVLIVEPDVAKQLRSYNGFRCSTVLKISLDQLRRYDPSITCVDESIHLFSNLDFKYIWVTMDSYGSVLFGKMEDKYRLIQHIKLADDLKKENVTGVGHGDIAVAGVTYWLHTSRTHDLQNDIRLAVNYGTYLSALVADRPGTIQLVDQDDQSVVAYMKEIECL